MEDRIIASALQDEDAQIEYSLRPRTMAEFIGQEKVKEKMHICIEAARLRDEPLEHLLFYGPPGLGKTTLSAIVANEMGVNIRVTSGPAIERQGDLAAILTNLAPGDVLFIDEIHRLNPNVEEILYPAMEDYSLDIIIGKGPSARSLRLELPRFTLVGATTRAGLLTAPLRDRFGMVNRLELYSPEELGIIVERSAGILDIRIEREGAVEIARRARGTPRIANRLLRRVRDFAQIRADGVITRDVADAALRLNEVDELGLDNEDRRLLLAIVDKFGGGPVGLDTLSAATGEEATTIEDVYEPYLLQLGFIQKTPRRRMATRLAYGHLGQAAAQGDPEADFVHGLRFRLKTSRDFHYDLPEGRIAQQPFPKRTHPG